MFDWNSQHYSIEMFYLIIERACLEIPYNAFWGIFVIYGQDGTPHISVCNTLGWDRLEVISVSHDMVEGMIEQECKQTGEVYQLVNIPAYSVSQSGPHHFSAVHIDNQVWNKDSVNLCKSSIDADCN